MQTIAHRPATGEIRILDVTARCRCGSSRFDGCDGELHAGSLLTCARCGQTTSYLTLLDQIGEQAMHSAHQSLARLKRMARRRR